MKIEKHENKKIENDQTDQSLELIKKQKINKDIILHIDIGQKIERGEDLLSYNKNIPVNNYQIQKQLNNALTIEKTNVIDEVQMELEDYKSAIKRYIEERNTFRFDRYFELYFKLAEVFLNELSKHGQFSYQDAKQYTSIMNFGKNEGWPPLTWLRDHAIDLFKETKGLKSNKLYNKIQWLPYHLICLSLEKDDHLLFQESFFLWERQFSSLSEDKELSKEYITFFKENLMPIILKILNIKEKTLFKKKKKDMLFFY